MKFRPLARLILALLAYSCAWAKPSTSTPYYAPGDSSWLGGNPSWDKTPIDYEKYFPIVYVVFGFEGIPHVRSIIGETSPCPKAMNKAKDKIFTLAQGAASTVRAEGKTVNDNKLPYKFPVRVCEIVAEPNSEFRQALADGDVVLAHNERTHTVPRVKTNPSRFLLIGDTGLRSKAKDLGLGKLGNGPKCHAPKVYGVNQCAENFTQADLIDNQTGSFQGTDEWVFKDLANDAATKDIDVIVSVGDYLYRQSPCPINNHDTSLTNEQKNCSGINGPAVANVSGPDDYLPRSTIMNFLPGRYGDNWWGWWADFFWPAMELLRSAPLIPTRGNHEICTRGGFGYFFFLSPQPLCPECKKDLLRFCKIGVGPFSVQFENEQFLVMDDALIDPYKGGIDHFKFINGSCPDPPPDGKKILVHQETRIDDGAQNQIDYFTEQFMIMEQMSNNYETNFYVGHRPLFGVACNNTVMATLDWTLQQSLTEKTLDRINALICGHMHWLEVLEFENNELPPQIVVGNGGTQMIPNYINQSVIPHLKLEVGREGENISGNVERGITLSKFGYGIMERNDKGYDVEFYVWNNTSSQVESLDYHMFIPKGPRVKQEEGYVSPVTAATY